jgi:hypothetical protein
MVDASRMQPNTCDVLGTQPYKGKEQQEGKGTITAN